MSLFSARLVLITLPLDVTDALINRATHRVEVDILVQCAYVLWKEMKFFHIHVKNFFSLLKIQNQYTSIAD